MATFSRPKQNPENYPENGTSPQIALWRLTLYLKIKPASTLSYNGTQSPPLQRVSSLVNCPTILNTSGWLGDLAPGSG